MVSGFLTSPCDHDRMVSGAAIEIRMALKATGFLGLSKTPKMSSILLLLPRCPLGPLGFLQQVNLQTQRLQLFDHYVEGFRQSRLQRVLALDDRLVHPCAAGHVIALDREHLL